MNTEVVIFATGERTAELSMELAQKQCPNVVMINDNRPLYKKLKDLYSRNFYKWTIISNGDLLFKKDAVANLYQYAEENEDDIFAAYGYINCKFLGLRYASPKIYKTSVFPHMVNQIKDVVRPEASAIGAIKKDHGRLDEIKTLTAIHDFEQYYADIFIKGFFYGIKFYDYVAKHRWKVWKQAAGQDKDMEVVMEGFKQGSLQKEKIGVSRNMFDATEILSRLKLKEKSPMKTFNTIEL